jgi:hypothetical protein
MTLVHFLILRKTEKFSKEHLTEQTIYSVQRHKITTDR